MEATQIQLLRDESEKPTDNIIADGLGTAADVYFKCIDELKQMDITLMDWRYYNDGKAWLSKGEYKWVTKRGTNKVKPIFWLSIWEDFFKVSFLFSGKIRDELLALSISEETKEIISNTVEMGKTMRYLPIIIDVDKVSQLEDVYTLANFRKANI